MSVAVAAVEDVTAPARVPALAVPVPVPVVDGSELVISGQLSV